MVFLVDIASGAARIAHTLLEGTAGYPPERSLPEADTPARRADSMVVDTAVATVDSMAAATADNTVVGKAVFDSLHCGYPSASRFVRAK